MSTFYLKYDTSPDGVRRDYGPVTMFGLGADANPTGVFTTAPAGTIQFNDGSIFDPSTNTAYDPQGNPISTPDVAALGAQIAQAGQTLQTIANAAAANAQLGVQINAQLLSAQQDYKNLQAAYDSFNSQWSLIWDLLKSAVDSGQSLTLDLSMYFSLRSMLSDLQAKIAGLQTQLAATNIQAQNTTQATATQFAALAASESAAGNTAMADYYNQLAAGAQVAATNISTLLNPKPPAPAPFDFGAWVQANWLDLAIVGAAIFIVPPLIKKL